METYNRFTLSHKSSLNSYLACASTGKAALNIGGTTVHSAFRLAKAKSKRRGETAGLSQEALQSFRSIKSIKSNVLIGFDLASPLS